MLDPKVDVVFKLLMARPDNAPLLRSMIEAVVDLPSPIDEVTVLNPEIPRDLAAHKTVVLDVHVRCDDGTLLDIEMETQPRAVLTQRALFYWASLYSGQLGHGESYAQLRRTISIVWLNGTLPLLEGRFHSTFRVKEEETGRRLSDHLEMHLLALPHVSGPQVISERLGRWARFFLAGDAAELHALAVEDGTMSKAVDELERLSGDPAARRLLDDLERARRFHGHEMAVEREDALRKVARNLLDMGMAPAEVSRATELSLGTVAAIQASRG